MRSKHWLFLLSAITLPTPVLAREAPPAFLAFGSEIDAPRGYVEMCANDAALCRRFRPAPSVKAQPVPAPVEPAPNPLALAAFDGLTLRATPRFAPSLAQDLSTITHPIAAIKLGLTAPPTPSLDLVALAGLRAPQPPVPARPAPITEDRLALLRQPTAAILRPPLPEQPPVETEPANAPDEKALMKLLQSVNAHVNRRVFQQTDMVLYGRPEVWRPSGDARNAMGDCEDMALEKRLELIAANFPRERLFMAVVFSGNAGLHAVLVARMAQGDLVLDSRANYLTGWASSGYEWLSVESPQEPDRWFAPA